MVNQTELTPSTYKLRQAVQNMPISERKKTRPLVILNSTGLEIRRQCITQKLEILVYGKDEGFFFFVCRQRQ